MAYTINLTNGTVFATIPDGTTNTSSSMILIGKNYAGYGEFLDENFIHLLENSANSTAPSAPLTGQLWYDSSASVIKVYNGTTWKAIAAATASSSAPSSNTTGDLWFDTTNQQLKIWTGSAWLTVGPAYSASQGLSGAIALTINDNTATPHVVTGLYAANTLVSIVSPDSDFVPEASYLSTFPVIYKGTTVLATGAQAGNIKGAGNVYVTANGVSTLNVTSSGLEITGFASASGNVTGGNVTTVGAVSATGNVSGSFFIGNGSQLTGIASSYGNSNVATFMANYGSNNISTTGSVTSGSLTVNSINHSGSNGVGNIGSSSNYFNYVFATATTALYADVAERFAADEALPAGTVVELGGTAEITKSRQDLSDKVFGVISTRAAYLMNGGAGTDETHPPVAMTGRVPVKVIGQVCKGDRLVSAGDGIARSALPGEATAFNTIGRALADKTTSEIGLVEAIVTIK